MDEYQHLRESADVEARQTDVCPGSPTGEHAFEMLPRYTEKVYCTRCAQVRWLKETTR